MSDTATDTGVVHKTDSDVVDELAAFFDVDENQPSQDDEVQTARDEDESTGETDDSLMETEAEGQDAPERNETEDEGEEPAEDERWMPQTLNDLAEALETDLDTVTRQIKVRTKLDGEEGEATLADVLKSYQLEGTLNKRFEAAAKERQEFEADRAKTMQTLQEKTQEAENLVSAMEQLVVSDYQSVDWADLKENDPTEFLMQQQRLQQKFADVQSAKNKIEANKKQDTEKQQQEYRANLEQYAKAERARLEEKIPEWRDASKMQEGLSQVSQYLKSQGATDQEIGTIVDHRVYVMARKAMMYDQMQSKADPKVKQMKTKPKFVPPGKRTTVQEVSEGNQKRSFAKAKKLQTDDAWADALEQRLFKT